MGSQGTGLQVQRYTREMGQAQARLPLMELLGFHHGLGLQVSWVKGRRFTGLRFRVEGLGFRFEDAGSRV